MRSRLNWLQIQQQIALKCILLTRCKMDLYHPTSQDHACLCCPSRLFMLFSPWHVICRLFHDRRRHFVNDLSLSPDQLPGTHCQTTLRPQIHRHFQVHVKNSCLCSHQFETIHTVLVMTDDIYLLFMVFGLQSLPLRSRNLRT